MLVPTCCAATLDYAPVAAIERQISAEAQPKFGLRAPTSASVSGPTISKYQSAEFGVQIAEHLSKLEALATESHLWPKGLCGPTSDALATARAVLLRLASNDSSLVPDKIVATVDQGVAICFVSGNRYSDIECLGEGGILGVTTDRRGGPSVWEIDTSLSGIDSAAIRIRRFIGTNPAPLAATGTPG